MDIPFHGPVTTFDTLATAADAHQLPLLTNIIIFLLWATVASFTALWVCYYYGRKDMSLYVRVTCICSYIACFMSMYFVSLDVTGGYREELHYIWVIYYSLVSCGCWIIVPFSQSYNDNGGFNIKDKIILTIEDEGLFYGIVLLVAAGILGFMYIFYDFGTDTLWSLVLNLANTFGFIILTFFFGSGLVNFPLSMWQAANRERGARFGIYKLGKLNEKIQLEQDRLQQTNAYCDNLADNCPAEYRELFDIIRAKLPPPTAYEFAFIGLSTMTEAHGVLESLQKRSFNDLKRKHYIELHYVVINHRRSLAMFQSEWRETMDSYLYLTQVAELKQKYPKINDLPPSEFIEPGEDTYSNFPGSFLWTLPCCCGEREGALDTPHGNSAQNDVSIYDDLNTMTTTPDSTADFTPHPSNPGTPILKRNIDSSTVPGSSSHNDPIHDAPDLCSGGDVHVNIVGTPNILNRPMARSGFIDNNTVTNQQEDIYDDMTTRHMSNLAEQMTLHTKLMLTAANVSSWIFRKPPQMLPGTPFYRLTMNWFRFVVYLQPLVKRILAIICMLFSLMLLWCEITIMVPYNLSPISFLAHIDGASITTQTLLRILPLPYIIACTYYTVYHINLGWWFHMQTAHRTSIRSMLFSCSFMLRTIFTTTYNYYQMCRVTDTAFLDFVGPMEILPLLGNTFNLIMPLFVVLFAILTALDAWSVLLRFFGVPHFDFQMNDAESGSMMEDGKILIEKNAQALRGERVEHFRSREVDAARLAQKRNEKRKAQNGVELDENGEPHRNESDAVRAIRLRREREKQEKDAQEYAQHHDPELVAPSATGARASAVASGTRSQYSSTTTTTSSSSSSNATAKSKYSQRAPQTNLDDF